MEDNIYLDKSHGQNQTPNWWSGLCKSSRLTAGRSPPHRKPGTILGLKRDRLILPFEVILFQFIAQHPFADAQQVRRFRSDDAPVFSMASRISFPSFLHRSRAFLPILVPFSSNPHIFTERKILHRNHRIPADDHRPFDDVLSFSDVTRIAYFKSRSCASLLIPSISLPFSSA